MSRQANRQTRALIFAPHPDDAEFYMGGTLLQMCKCGVSATVVVVTAGHQHPVASAETRRQEQIKAAEMGGYDLLWLDYPDCNIPQDRAIATNFRDIVLANCPELVFAPLPWGDKVSFHSFHSDHIRTGLAVREAAMLARVPSQTQPGHRISALLYYGAPLSGPATVLVDVEPTLNRLSELLSCFQSQLNNPKTGLDSLLSMRLSMRLYANGSAAEFFCADGPLVLDVRQLFARGIDAP